VSELRDRLEALAARGKRRGVDEVLELARRDAQAASAERASESEVEMTNADDVLPIVTPDLAPRRRRRFGSFVAAAGIAALVGVGALAITALFGSGGAGSPDGAVRQLADAISHKDPLAAVDVLVPSEVRSLRETVHAATQKAADLKIVNDAGQPLAGVDLSVDNLQLTTESLADGFAKVTVTSGEISASTHKAQLSALLQKAAAISGDAQGKADLSKLAANADLPTFVVVVRQDGRWYVSPAYTALEYARESNGGPAADFGSAAKAADLGSSTPEGAVSDALHAAQAGNWDRLFALAPPDELPLYDYRAFLDEQTSGSDAPDFTIDHLSTTATVSGDTGTVELTASGVSGTDHQKWQVGGTCPSLFDASNSGMVSGSFTQASGSLGAPTKDTSSSDSGPGLCLSGDGGYAFPFSLIGMGADTQQTSGPVSISVVRENGRWFVSPVTTVLGLVDKTIENLDQRTAYTVLGFAYQLPPDGTITLNQPFDVAPSKGLLASQVYAFDGQAGEKIIGEASGDGSNIYAQAFGTLYTVDGHEVGSVEFTPVPAPTGTGQEFTFASSTTLPSAGSYRLVLEPFYRSTATHTLTLWDLAQAPKALRDAAARNDSQFGNENCSSSPGLLGSSSSSCVSTGVATAPTVPEAPTASATATTSPTHETFIGGNSSGSGSAQTTTSVATGP
jgi:hypothetical protein